MSNYENWSFVTVDIETTGLDHNKGGITEICAIESYDKDFKSNNVIMNQLTNPQTNISKLITDITGITNEMVKNMVTDEMSTNTLFNRVGREKIIVAHNAIFEKKWLEKGHFFAIDKTYICTGAVFLYMMDGYVGRNKFKKNYWKLENVCNHFGIVYDRGKAHRAEYDVTRTMLVMREFAKRFSVEKMVRISKGFMESGFYKDKKDGQICLDL